MLWSSTTASTSPAWAVSWAPPWLARNFSGAVIDGGVRDTAYLQKIGFPVFALGTVPSTSVSHYRFAGANIPVICDGVPVSAGDIVAADSDGVVVVPRAKAAEVLALAQDMDFKEHSMYAYIEKLKSIEEAVKKFGRLTEIKQSQLQ